MNKIITYISLVCVGVALLLTSCKENEDTTPKGIVYVNNQVFPTNVFNFQVINNQTNKVVTFKGDTVYKFPVRTLFGLPEAEYRTGPVLHVLLTY